MSGRGEGGSLEGRLKIGTPSEWPGGGWEPRGGRPLPCAAAYRCCLPLRPAAAVCVVLASDSHVAAAKSSTMVGDTGIAITTGPTVLDIGRVTGIEINHAAQTEAAAGGPSVCVKISPGEGQAAVMFGRQFDGAAAPAPVAAGGRGGKTPCPRPPAAPGAETYLLYSHVSRKSIETLKEHFKDQMTKADWKTVIKLKVCTGGRGRGRGRGLAAASHAASPSACLPTAGGARRGLSMRASLLRMCTSVNGCVVPA